MDNFNKHEHHITERRTQDISLTIASSSNATVALFVRNFENSSFDQKVRE